MESVVRRTLFALLAVFALLGTGATLHAYPVKININVTFATIPGQPDPLGLGSASPPITATISTTLESSTPMASYPATVYLTLPAVGLTNSAQSGSLSINTNGQITASFSAPGSGSFTATLALEGVTFPSPTPTAFGTASFSSPASSVNYNLLGEVGTVGVNGTITAVGLTASPSSITANYSPGGSAPPSQTISVSSNDPANPALSFTAAVANATTPFLTLAPTSGTTPASVIATFSTSVPQGTYNATVQINTAGSSGAPISIPVTYTVGPAQTGPSLQVSPSSLSFQFYLPGSTTSATQSVAVTASSGPSAAFSASVGSSTFLSVTPSSGSTPSTLMITANATGLSSGTHTGSVVLTSSTLGSLTIPVTVVVGQSGGGGSTTSLIVLPTSVQFNYVTGQAAPAPQVVTVSNAGPNPPPVTFTVGNVAFYVPVTPLSGTTPTTVSIGLDPSKLSPGNYTDNLSFRSSTGAVTTVPVFVSVISPGANLLTIAPTTLSFTYTGNGAPPSQTVSVTAASSTGFVVTPSAPWLTVVPPNAITPGSLTVTANPTGLANGTYSATLTLTPTTTGASPQAIPVTFTVGSVQTSSALPIAFAYQIGGPVPAAQSVAVPGLTGATVPPTVVGASWLSVVNSSDLSTSTLTVDATGLGAGVYNGALKFVGPGTPGTVTYVPVTLTVSASAVIGVSPTSLNFNDPANGPVPAVQELDVSSTTGAAVTVTSDSTWLTATPSTTLTVGTSQVFDVTATPGSLGAGIYSGKLTLTSGSATTTVPVILDIGQTATPVITAVTNGISYQNAIGAPGLIISVWGTGLGAPPCTGSASCVGTGATYVFADGIPCPVLFASDGQVNAVLPFSLAGQTTADIQVIYHGITSNTVSMAIQAVAPSIFTSNAQGNGGGAILNQDLSINSASNPAPAGTIVAIYGGGGGQTNPLGIDGLLTPVTPPFPMPVTQATVQIAGQPATVSYYGDAPGLVAGVLQINAMIPAGTPSGPQPIVLSVGGVTSQPNVVVYVK